MALARHACAAAAGGRGANLRLRPIGRLPAVCISAPSIRMQAAALTSRPAAARPHVAPMGSARRPMRCAALPKDGHDSVTERAGVLLTGLAASAVRVFSALARSGAPARPAAPLQRSRP